jgi:hypothetical protein
MQGTPRQHQQLLPHPDCRRRRRPGTCEAASLSCGPCRAFGGNAVAVAVESSLSAAQLRPARRCRGRCYGRELGPRGDQPPGKARSRRLPARRCGRDAGTSAGAAARRPPRPVPGRDPAGGKENRRSLEQRGYATTERDSRDTRQLKVALTPAGRDYARAVIAVIAVIAVTAELNREVAGRVTPAQLEGADTVLRAALFDDGVRQRASRLPPPSGQTSG